VVVKRKKLKPRTRSTVKRSMSDVHLQLRKIESQQGKETRIDGRMPPIVSFGPDKSMTDSLSKRGGFRRETEEERKAREFDIFIKERRNTVSETERTEEHRGRTRTRSDTNSGVRDITAADTTAWHLDELAWLTAQIREAKKMGEKIIVLTHHSPIAGLGCGNSEKVSGLHTKHTSAYWTDLFSLMGDPTVWAYGHTHWFHDMTINGTRVVSNPHGYPIFGERIGEYVARDDSNNGYSSSFVVEV